VTYVTTDKIQHKGKIWHDGVKIMTHNDSKLGTCEFANTVEWIKALDQFLPVTLVTTPSSLIQHLSPENRPYYNPKIKFDGAFQDDLLSSDITNSITKNMIVSGFYDVNIDYSDASGDDIGDADDRDVVVGTVVQIKHDQQELQYHERLDYNPDNGDFEY